MSRQFHLTPLLITLMTWYSISSAAEPTRNVGGEVNDDEVARVVRSLPKVSDDDIERAAGRAKTPTAKALLSSPVPSVPRTETLPFPANSKDVDLGAVTKGYEKSVDEMMAGSSVLSQQPTLLIFVSFTLSDGTLQRLVEQAARASGSLVLRGVTNGSLKETVLRVQKLIGNKNVAIKIDPQAFERFAITQAPTFVLIRAGAEPVSCGDSRCLRPDSFVSVAGDVSLGYALERIKSAAPAFRSEAAHFLTRLGG